MFFWRGFLIFHAREISWFSINSKLLPLCTLWQNIWYSMILSCSSPSPTSWPGWACQCLWQSPIFLKAITYFSKLARSSLTMFMARTIVISKPKSMLFNLLVWFSEGFHFFWWLLTLILSRFVTFGRTHISTYRAVAPIKKLLEFFHQRQIKRNKWLIRTCNKY